MYKLDVLVCSAT